MCFFLVMRAVGNYSLHVQISDAAVLTVVMLNTPSLAVTYRITGSVYLGTAFLRFPSRAPCFGNHKSERFASLLGVVGQCTQP